MERRLHYPRRHLLSEAPPHGSPEELVELVEENELWSFRAKKVELGQL